MEEGASIQHGAGNRRKTVGDTAQLRIPGPAHRVALNGDPGPVVQSKPEPDVSGPLHHDHAVLWLEGDTKGVMSGLGFHTTIVERPRNQLEAIAAARTAFARCQFDEQGCDLGLRRLRAYRKEWDESRRVWKDRPRLDEASSGADAFLTFACSG
jgi:hypothetical protein